MRQVDIKLLPDDSGRVRIHYFHRDPEGPIVMPGGIVMSSVGPVQVGGDRGRIACMPKETAITPRFDGGKIRPLPHTDHPPAATCPECRASEYWKTSMALLEELLHTATQVT